DRAPPQHRHADLRLRPGHVHIVEVVFLRRIAFDRGRIDAILDHGGERCPGDERLTDDTLLVAHEPAILADSRRYMVIVQRPVTPPRDVVFTGPDEPHRILGSGRLRDRGHFSAVVGLWIGPA